MGKPPNMNILVWSKGLVGKKYYQLILGMWQMLSFKNLCLGELELLGQVAMARQWVRKWFGTSRGEPGRCGSPEATGEKTHSLSFTYSPGRGSQHGSAVHQFPHKQLRDSCLDSRFLYFQVLVSFNPMIREGGRNHYLPITKEIETLWS